MNAFPKFTRVAVHGNLVEYFKDLVRGALRNQQVDTDEMAEFYLVHLLSEFHRSEKSHAGAVQSGNVEPVALAFLRAQNLHPNERFNLLKNIGDQSLYFSGFFSEHLESTPVGLKYYMNLGEGAYTQVADLVLQKNANLQDLFQELSKKFSIFVDILSEVSETAGPRKDADLLKLYERWLQTGSNRAAKVLTKAGIPLTDIDPESIQ